MSYAPCANCRSTSNGRLSYFYLNAFEGEQRLNYRLRLCAVCVQQLVMDLISCADRKDGDGQWRAPEWWG